MSSQLFETLRKNAFPNQSLDDKDRKIIVTAYKHGHEGIGFNKFVQELKPHVSRSTVAFRVERLSKLGYLERINSRPKTSTKTKPVRVSFKCYSVLSVLDQTQSKTADLLRRIKEESSRQERASPTADVDSFKRWYQDVRDQWNSCFGMTGSIALLYGERAASDLFLPLIMESYMKLASEFFSFLNDKPNSLELMRQITGEQLALRGTSLQNIKEQVSEQMKKLSEVLK